MCEHYARLGFSLINGVPWINGYISFIILLWRMQTAAVTSRIVCANHKLLAVDRKQCGQSNSY